MNTKLLWGIIIILFLVILGLTWVLFTTPGPTLQTAATSTVSTSSPHTATTTPALHDRVVVTSPATGATVGQSFTIAGEVPGSWSFEAQFPIQVRDADNNKIGQAAASLQGDWMTEALVPFTAHITLDTPYHGPATLVLLKDNPSGLPQNDDSFEVSIVVQ